MPTLSQTPHSRSSKMANLSAVLGCVVLFLSAIAPASAATHKIAWSLGTDYSSLTSGSTFVVGDTLLFNYGGGHTVDEVTQSDYQSCSVGKSISSDSTGTTSIALKTPGTHYFICAVPGHCSGGMKLAVTVAAGGSGTGGSTTTPSSGGGPTTTTPTPASGGSGRTTTRPASPSASAAISPPLAASVATLVSALYVLAFS